MTDKKREEPKKAPKKDKFQEEFEALPLEEKITNLFKMEVVTLGETLTYVANSVAEFGSRVEKEVRKATSSATCAPEPEKAKGKNPPRSAPHPPVG